MLAGDVTSATVPWAKVNPVIAPQVLRLTSAVACDQDGLLLLTVRVGSPPSLGSLGVRQGLEDLLHLRVAGIAGVLEQHARVLRGHRAGAGHPLLVHVGDERRPSLPAGHRAGAQAGEAGVRDDGRRTGVPGAVLRLGLQPRLDRRSAVRAGQRGSADDVVDGPRRHLQAVDRAERVVGMVQVQRPRDLAALGRRNGLKSLPARLGVGVAGVVAARQQREDPQDLAGVLGAGEVDLARLGGHVRVLAGSCDLAPDGGHAGRPRRARPQDDQRADADNSETSHRTDGNLAAATRTTAPGRTRPGCLLLARTLSAGALPARILSAGARPTGVLATRTLSARVRLAGLLAGRLLPGCVPVGGLSADRPRPGGLPSLLDQGLGPDLIASERRRPRGPQELPLPGSARAAERHGVSGLRFAGAPAVLPFVIFPFGFRLVGLPAKPDIGLGVVRLVAVIGQVRLWLQFRLRFLEIPGSSGAVLPLPAPRWTGELPGPCFSPFGDVLLDRKSVV